MVGSLMVCLCLYVEVRGFIIIKFVFIKIFENIYYKEISFIKFKKKKYE